jgi:hypothetical protein
MLQQAKRRALSRALRERKNKNLALRWTFILACRSDVGQ